MTFASHAEAHQGYDCSRLLKNQKQSMSSDPSVRERRGSTRVCLKLEIEAKGISEPFHCEGETHVINLHGALISTSVPLRVGMEIELHVIQTDNRSPAKVVYVDPDHPRHSGIKLEEPQNIWGVALPPEDWRESHGD